MMSPADDVRSEALDPEFAGTVSGLLDAVTSLSSDLDTRSVLSRIVVAACGLTGARYGALGVIGPDGGLSDFVTHGVSAAEIDLIGHPPVGRGLLDLALTEAGPLRLPDLHQHPASVGFPEHHPEMRTLLIVPIRVRGTPFGNLYLTEKGGGETFTRHDESQIMALGTVAGFVIENAHAFRVSERRRRWLEMFGDLNELIQPPIGLEQALERVASVIRNAAEARTAAVFQVPTDGTPYVAAVSGEPLAAADRRALEDSVQATAANGSIGQEELSEDRIVLLAPLNAHLATPGVVAVIHPPHSGRDFVDEIELMASFADQVGLALDRTQALEDREQMAVIADRDRIARDLHDVVIQRLFALGLHMQSIRSAASDNPALKERIDNSARELDQTIRDIRNTIFGLQSTPQNSLRSEIRDLVREYIPMLGFAPSVQLHGRVDFPIDPQVQQVLGAVLREALTNVAQHAQAGSASVELQVTETDLRLTVADNGRGLPDERHENGLRTSRRRAVVLGGSLDLAPNEPSGTVFVWSVPLEPN
jgi:signal transduction histidine kinase